MVSCLGNVKLYLPVMIRSWHGEVFQISKPCQICVHELSLISLTIHEVIIQISPKYSVIFTWWIIIQAGHNFAHATTAKLSWHVQNCDMIGSPGFKWEQNKFSWDFSDELVKVWVNGWMMCVLVGQWRTVEDNLPCCCPGAWLSR